MKTDKRIYRTGDGQRHVLAGEDAAVLAYAVGADVPDAVAEQVGLVQPQAKQAEPAEDKQAEPPANKTSGTSGSGSRRKKS